MKVDSQYYDPKWMEIFSRVFASIYEKDDTDYWVIRSCMPINVWQSFECSIIAAQILEEANDK